MEYCGGGTLKDHLRREGLPEPLVAIWADQILSAIGFLQTNPGNNGIIVHRDLKPENVRLATRYYFTYCYKILFSNPKEDLAQLKS